MELFTVKMTLLMAPDMGFDWLTFFGDSNFTERWEKVDEGMRQFQFAIAWEILELIKYAAGHVRHFVWLLSTEMKSPHTLNQIGTRGSYKSCISLSSMMESSLSTTWRTTSLTSRLEVVSWKELTKRFKRRLPCGTPPRVLKSGLCTSPGFYWGGSGSGTFVDLRNIKTIHIIIKSMRYNQCYLVTVDLSWLWWLVMVMSWLGP